MTWNVAVTTIINETTQPVLIKGGSHARDYCVFHRLLPEKKYTLEYFLNDNVNVHSFTFAVGDTMIPVYPDDGSGYLIHPDHLAKAEEVIIHETLNHQAVGWRISKQREGCQEYHHLADFEAFSIAVRKNVHSRIETIKTSCLRLNNFLENVKIWSAQCKNLVQICSQGVANMIEFYAPVSRNDNYMWGLYTSKKLRHLDSALDRVISSLESIEELLQACGSQWCRMGLVVSAFPLPRPVTKTSTKFDLLIKELTWNLDTIQYILDLTEDVQLNWNNDKCRYVLEKKQGTGIGGEVGMEFGECGTDVAEARADLLFQIKNGAISRKEIFHWIWVLSSYSLSIVVGNISFHIWKGSLIISGGDIFMFLVIYCFAIMLLLAVKIPIPVRATVIERNILGLLLFSMDGRKWYELNLEDEAPYQIFAVIVLLMFWGLVSAVLLVSGVDLVFDIKIGSISIKEAFLPLFRMYSVFPGWFLLVLSTSIGELLLWSILAWENRTPLPTSMFLFIGGLSWFLVMEDFREIESELLSRENIVFRIRVIYVFKLLGGLIGIVFKIQNGFILWKEAASILLSRLLCRSVGFIHLIGGAILLFVSKTEPLFPEAKTVFHLCFGWFLHSALVLSRHGIDEMIYRRPLIAALWIFGGASLVMWAAKIHVFYQIKQFQIKNGWAAPHLEFFVLMSVCFVLLLRAAEPLEDWLERYGRKHFPQYGERRYFEEDVLKQRLQYSGETNKSVESSIAPFCFQIDHEYLKFETKIAGGNSPRAIYRGFWRGLEVAIAVLQNLEVGEYNRKSQSLGIQEEIKKMAALMLRLQHPNIVDFFGYSFKPDRSPDYGGDDDEPVAAGYLVMELMQGDLRQVIDRLVLKQPGRPFPDDVAVDILLQIAGAMSHMHDCGVLYRDLKAKNCVVSQRSLSQSNSQVLRKFYTVKLIDFDISKLLDQYATDHTLMRGTTRWMAPEVWGIGVYVPGVLCQKAPYDTSIDVYSFGMTCYEVITGLHPFCEYCKSDEIRSALENGKRPEFPPGMSCPRALEELMSRCWAEEPSARPNFKEIVKALWTIKYELELQQ